MRTHRTTSALHLAALGCFAASLMTLGGCGSAPKSGPAESAAVSGKYAFWPQFPAEPRIQFLRSISSSEDVAPSNASGLDKLVFGKQAGDSESVNKPYGAAMHDGKIYVCDIRDACVTVLDMRKHQTRIMGATGSMQMKRPVAVAVADDGQIYVADNERGAILVFDPQERYTRAMGHEKLKPAGLAIHGNRLYVADVTSQLVEIYDAQRGEQTGTIGTVGDGDGQFRLPLGVAVGPTGDVFVTDMMLCRVQKFSPDGKFISKFGTLGDYAGTFVRPKHIAVDSDGIIYVVDAAFQNVQMFDDQHRLLMHFGSNGNFPGAMNLPAGICVTDDSSDVLKELVHPGFKTKRIVIVTNQFGDAKVSLYAMGGLREGFTAKDLAAAAAPVSEGTGEGAKDILPPPTPGLLEGAPQPANPGDAPRPTAGSNGAAAAPADAKPAQGTPPAKPQ